MIVSSYSGHLLDQQETFDIINTVGFKATSFGGLRHCLLGYLGKQPLMVRCMLKEWQRMNDDTTLATS